MSSRPSSTSSSMAISSVLPHRASSPAQDQLLASSGLNNGSQQSTLAQSDQPCAMTAVRH